MASHLGPYSLCVGLIIPLSRRRLGETSWQQPSVSQVWAWQPLSPVLGPSGRLTPRLCRDPEACLPVTPDGIELGAAGSGQRSPSGRSGSQLSPKGRRCQGPRRCGLRVPWWTHTPSGKAQGASCRQGWGRSREPFVMGRVHLRDGGGAAVATAGGGPGEEGPGVVMAQEVPGLGCQGPELSTWLRGPCGAWLRGCVPSRSPLCSSAW